MRRDPALPTAAAVGATAFLTMVLLLLLGLVAPSDAEPAPDVRPNVATTTTTDP